jgi:hypothetical protein
MPEQLFRFEAKDRKFVISGIDEWGARATLRRYLNSHPMLLIRMEDVRCKEVLGKVDDGIYTLSGI